MKCEKCGMEILEGNLCENCNVLNYKNGELSLCAFVHDYDEIASLYNMIYDDHFNIYTLPNEYLKELFTEEDKLHNLECVLDLSSLILLQQVDVQYGLIYNSKFLIPISLHYLLKEAKIKEETSTPSLLYQSVIDTVIIKYEDETKTPLWNLINNLLSWIETRCEIKIVEDKLFYVVQHGGLIENPNYEQELAQQGCPG